MWWITKDSRDLRYKSGDYRPERYDLDKAAESIIKWNKENK